MVGRVLSLLSAALVLIFRSHFVVRGDSMIPALRDGDLVHSIPSRLAPGRIRRGALVVANALDGSDRILIKRIAALPGQSVHVAADGTISVDAGRRKHGSLAAPQVRALETRNTWYCEKDEYFLLGDNLSESADSRRYGPAPATGIIGCVWLTIPTHRLRRRRIPPSC